MRNGSVTADHLAEVRQASDIFLGRFAADCLLSRCDALDRIAHDLRFSAAAAATDWPRHSNNGPNATGK